MNFVPRHIWVLVLIVTITSGFYSFYYHDRPRVDAKAYDAIAQNIASGNGYIEKRENITIPERDDAIVRIGPGYQFFLAGIYAVFGHHIEIVWLAHALLRGGSVALIYALALLLFSSKLNHDTQVHYIAFGAAVLFGFIPDLIVINGLLLTETLFLFLFILAIYLSLQVIKEENNLQKIFIVGIVWALAILVRPVAILPLLILGGIFLWWRQYYSVCVLMIAPLVLIGSWSAVMSYRYDSFILTTTAGELDIWVGNNLEATGGFTKTLEIQAIRDTTHSVNFGSLARKKYIEFLTQHPVQFIELQWRKTALYFSLLRPTGFWIHLIAYPVDRLITLISSGIITMILFVVGIAGGFLLWQKQQDYKTRLFLFFAFLQPISVIPIIVETRYRYALFPFLSILVAYWIVMNTNTTWFKSRYLLYSMLLFMIFTGYDMWVNGVEIIEKIQKAIPF